MSVVLLSACATTQPGIQVTRFHLDPPGAGETIVIEPGATINAESLEYQSYLQSVGMALTNVGFVVGDDAATDLLVNVNIKTGMQAKPRKESPVRVGVGGGSYGGSVGVGGGINFPVGSSGGGEVYVAELKLEMVRQSTQSVVWEGTAKRESKTAPASPADNMRALAAALLMDFPGESGSTVIAQ